MVEFAKHIADFVAKSGKKHVVVLSSLDFGRWRNIDLSRYVIPFSFPAVMCQALLINQNISLSKLERLALLCEGFDHITLQY